MSPKQSNTQEGLVNLKTGTNLAAAITAGTDVIGLLAKPVAGGATGIGKAELAAAIGDLSLYVIEDVTSVGAGWCTVRPMYGNRNVRLRTVGGAGGSCGDFIVADAGNSGFAAKKAAPATGDFIIGVAEEDFVAGQSVLVRPIGQVKA